jgi:hypothetical protein
VKQEVDTVAPAEAVFELREVPGPVFALKQQGDTPRTSHQTAEQLHDQ